MGDNTAPSHLPASIGATVAREAFLDRYTSGTKKLYRLDLKIYFDWCAAFPIDPLDVKRPHLEAFGRHLMHEMNNGARSTARRLQTIRSFYRLATADEMIDRDPSLMMAIPKWKHAVRTKEHLSPAHTAMLLAAAEKISPAHHALVALMLYLGLRVSEACSVRIENMTHDPASGYMMINGVRKGGYLLEAPAPMPLLRILRAAIGDREEGPVVVTHGGNQQTRNGAYDWVKRIAKKAGLASLGVHPHALRHAAAKMLADAGVPLEEIQKFLGHVDVRSTMIYTNRKITPERYAGHMVARQVATYQLTA